MFNYQGINYNILHQNNSRTRFWFEWVFTHLMMGVFVFWRHSRQTQTPYPMQMSPEYLSNTVSSWSFDSVCLETLSLLALTPLYLHCLRQQSCPLFVPSYAVGTFFLQNSAYAQTTNNILDLNSTGFSGITFINAGSLTAVSYTQDINGDNLPEILIGSQYAPSQTRTSAGSTYLIWGNLSLPKIIDLAIWKTSNLGIRFDGAQSGDNLGVAVSSISDLNGDNLPEILMGAPYASPQGRNQAGSVYLIWGNGSLPNTIDLASWNTSTIGVRFDGASAGDNCGYALASTSDINGDKFSEILLGAKGANAQGRNDSGSTYLIWGKNNLPKIIDLAEWNSTTFGIRFDGAKTNGYSATTLSGLPDINGDNLAEILIGAWQEAPLGRNGQGCTYLIWGNPSLASTIDLGNWANLNIGVRFSGATGLDASGMYVGYSSDVDGDMLPEILITASAASPQNRKLAGSAYFIRGNRSFANSIDLANWDSINIGVRFDGATAGGLSTMTSTPDINGDGLPELLLGASRLSEHNRNNSGSIYLLWGIQNPPNNIDLTTWNTSNLGIRIDGAEAAERCGLSLTSIPDLDSDNRPEILIATQRGKIHLVMSTSFGLNLTHTTTYNNISTSTKTNSTSPITTPSIIKTGTPSSSTVVDISTSFSTASSPILARTSSSNSSPLETSNSLASSSALSGLATSTSAQSQTNVPFSATLSSPIDRTSATNYSIISGAVGGAALVALLAGIGIYARHKTRHHSNQNVTTSLEASPSTSQEGSINLRSSEYASFAVRDGDQLPSRDDAKHSPTNEYGSAPKPQHLNTHYSSSLPGLSENPYAANSEQWVSVGELNAEFDKAKAAEIQKASSNYAGFPDSSSDAHYSDIDIVQQIRK